MLKKSPFLSAILVILTAYLGLKFGVQPILPQSLMIQYMVFIVLAVGLVVSFDDATFAAFLRPVKNILGNPSKARLKWLFLSLLPGLLALQVYDWVRPKAEAPVETRSVHPAPPSSLKVYGKTYDLQKLENPLRADKAAYQENVEAGGEVYFKNCFFCHGDKLDGQGHFANAIDPKPANFQDVGTIAQLQESYLFWRITTGGPGLPSEGAPWASMMPVWQEILSEKEIWQVILFLYDYTGHEPRSWEIEKKKDEGPKIAPLKDATAIYQTRCKWCHGAEGAGDGVAALLQYPRPRIFTSGQFKFKSNISDEEVATKADLEKTIASGLPGTAMPGWADLIGPKDREALIQHILNFGEIEAEDIGKTPVNLGTEVASSPDSIKKGAALFEKACVQCHGKEGRGNITSGKKLGDDWGQRLWPRNLTLPDTWRYSFSRREIFERISAGIPGTPMPNHTDTISIEERWHLVNFVETLKQKSVPVDPKKNVVFASKVAGELPLKVNAEDWAAAKPVSFNLFPQIVREPRKYTSLLNQVTARTLYNEKEIAFLIEWDDRTPSIPGTTAGAEYALDNVEMTPDAVALQFPFEPTEALSKPNLRHGDKTGVTQVWYWSVGGAVPGQGVLLKGKSRKASPSPTKEALEASGIWKDGRWRVIMKRPRAGLNGEGSEVFKGGAYIPLSFAAWDGNDGDKGAKHAQSSWYWLHLPTSPDPVKVYGFPVALFLFVFGLLFMWSRVETKARMEKKV